MTSLGTGALIEVTALVSAVKRDSPAETRGAVDSLLANPDAWAAVELLARMVACGGVVVDELATLASTRAAAEEWVE
jgi:hypothetical protein